MELTVTVSINTLYEAGVVPWDSSGPGRYGAAAHNRNAQAKKEADYRDSLADVLARNHFCNFFCKIAGASSKDWRTGEAHSVSRSGCIVSYKSGLSFTRVSDVIGFSHAPTVAQHPLILWCAPNWNAESATDMMDEEGEKQYTWETEYERTWLVSYRFYGLLTCQFLIKYANEMCTHPYTHGLHVCFREAIQEDAEGHLQTAADEDAYKAKRRK